MCEQLYELGHCQASHSSDRVDHSEWSVRPHAAALARSEQSARDGKMASTFFAISVDRGSHGARMSIEGRWSCWQQGAALVRIRARLARMAASAASSSISAGKSRADRGTRVSPRRARAPHRRCRSSRAHVMHGRRSLVACRGSGSPRVDDCVIANAGSACETKTHRSFLDLP